MTDTAEGHMTEEMARTFAVQEAIEKEFGLDNIPTLMSSYKFASFILPQVVGALKDAAGKLERGVPEGFLIGFCLGIAEYNIKAGQAGGVDGWTAAAKVASIVERVTMEHGGAGMAELMVRLEAEDPEAIEAMAKGTTLKAKRT